MVNKFFDFWSEKFGIKKFGKGFWGFLLWSFAVFSFFVFMYLLATLVISMPSCKSTKPGEIYFSGPFIRYARSSERYEAIKKAWIDARVALYDGRCSIAVAMLDGVGGVQPDLLRAVVDFVVIYDADDIKNKICKDKEFAAFNFGNTPVIVVCDSFYDFDETTKALIMIHEIAHVAGLRHDSKEMTSYIFQKKITEGCVHVFQKYERR